MKTGQIQILFSLLLTILIIACKNSPKEISNKNVYYINNQADFFKYSGTEFPEGSVILFAAGKVFSGQFVLKGSGTKEKPNLLTAYDPKTGDILPDWIENKPLINGQGQVSSAVFLFNGNNWEINNLEVTNSNGTNADQGKLLGIKIVAEDIGLAENIRIRNCFVHQVNGKVGGKETGGIHVYVTGKKLKTKFKGVLIEDNVVCDVGGVGIANQSSWGNINTDTYYPWNNLVIRGNWVERTGRNSIIVRYALDPVVERNIVAYSSRFDTGHSIFNFNTTGCIVQYNEAYGNTSPDKDETDRGGFDADYNSIGTIIQYNYSHDNHWFCGIMRRGHNTDVTIRYNISQNELLGAYMYGFGTEKGVKDVKVYNNTHYFGKGKGNKIFVSAGKDRVPIETIFKNNIFYFEDEASWGIEPDETCHFENNLFYNLPPKGVNALVANPLFLNPGSARTNIDMTHADRLSGYRLKVGSPAIGTGSIISDNGGIDFAGNPIKPEVVNIGAMQNP